VKFIDARNVSKMPNLYVYNLCVWYLAKTAAEMSIEQPIEKLPAIQRDQQFTVSNTQQRTKKRNNEIEAKAQQTKKKCKNTTQLILEYGNEWIRTM